MACIEAKTPIRPESADSVESALLEFGEPGWSLLENAIAKRAWIVGVFPDEAAGRASWRELRPLLPSPPPRAPAFRRLEDADWRNSYKAHFKAWRFGRLHWVPVWERARFRLPRGHAVLWLDPGMAFGTGNHETTRLCCERLAALAPETWGSRGRGIRVIDGGCGSGILALSAAVLGFRSVVGFDIDPEAVRVSRENAAANGLSRRVRFFEADLSKGLRGRQAEVVLANIQADILARHARLLVKAVAPGGVLVLSGILAAERDRVEAAFGKVLKRRDFESRTRGEWCDVALRR